MLETETKVGLQANYKAIDLVEFAESLKGISAYYNFN